MVSTFLTLIYVPLFYDLFEKAKLWLTGRHRSGLASEEAHPA